MQIVMELCHGDITRKDAVIWGTTLSEARQWGEYIVRRRYEWVEIIGMFFGVGDKPDSDKKCREAAICAICRKSCSQRLQ